MAADEVLRPGGEHQAAGARVGRLGGRRDPFGGRPDVVDPGLVGEVLDRGAGQTDLDR